MKGRPLRGGDRRLLVRFGPLEDASMKGRPLRGGDSVRSSRCGPAAESLDEGPPAQGRRPSAADPGRVGPMTWCLDEGPPAQGRRLPVPRSRRRPSSSLDEGPPAQGRRPRAQGCSCAVAADASLDEGPPAQGRRQGANFTASDLALWVLAAKAARYGCCFASRPGLASGECHLPVVSCAKGGWVPAGR